MNIIGITVNFIAIQFARRKKRSEKKKTRDTSRKKMCNANEIKNIFFDINFCMCFHTNVYARKLNKKWNLWEDDVQLLCLHTFHPRVMNMAYVCCEFMVGNEISLCADSNEIYSKISFLIKLFSDAVLNFPAVLHFEFLSPAPCFKLCGV